MNAKDLVEQGQNLFTKRSSLLMLWQETAENFYPERADFTFIRQLGTDFAGNMMTSFPILCRRDLGDQFGTQLRPTAKQWFHMTAAPGAKTTNEGKRWLEWATGTMRRAMYDPITQFTRATKEGDHDFACFGQTVLNVRMNRNHDGLLYRCFHLRDVAWQENEEGKIGCVWRKWKPTARDLKRLFGDKCHRDIDQMIQNKTPFEEVECMHIVVEADMYDEANRGKPYWSIYYDVAHHQILEAVAVWHNEYVIPRWQTVSGSQYAFSPAVVAALPEARLLQSMTYTLLEAGEKVTNPPMVVTQDVVRSDVAMFAGGLVWVDRDYDERLGDAVRPLNIDARGIPVGREMQTDSRTVLSQCFYLNKLSMPQRGPEMTAYEVGQRLQEYIRGALPLFEPMEMSYNGQLCELTFEILQRNGAFGSPQDMPEELMGQPLDWRFESPLHDAIEQQKGQKFIEMKGLIAQAVDLDPAVASLPDAVKAMRDALNGIQVPAEWLRDEPTMDEIQAQQKAAAQAQATLAAMQQGSEVANNLGMANKNNAQAAPPVAV